MLDFSAILFTTRDLREEAISACVDKVITFPIFMPRIKLSTARPLSFNMIGCSEERRTRLKSASSALVAAKDARRVWTTVRAFTA